MGIVNDIKSILKVPKKNYAKGDLPSDEDGWIQYVTRLHDHGLGARRKHELQWTINLAYYQGYQHLIYNARSGTLEVPRDNRQPLTINRIGSYVEARHAKLTKRRPIPRVIPNDNDIADQRGATYSDHALMDLWRKIDMEEEYDSTIMMSLLFGTSFMESLWDPTTGDTIETLKKSSNGQDLVIDEFGDMSEDIFMGEVSSRGLSPFAIIPANDQVPQVKDQEWMLKRSHISIAEAELRYPHLRGLLQMEGQETRYTQFEKTIHRLASPVFTSLGTMEAKRDSLNSQILQKTLWVKPNIQYERGVVVVVLGSHLAMIDVFPNDFGKNMYPFVKFQEKKDGVHFWTQSSVERLIPIQRAYNRAKQQTAKNVALMANGKWMAPKGAQLQEDSITDEEGEVIEYNPAVPEPHQANIAPLPNYVMEFPRELVNDFRDAGGQREASLTPGSNLTASVAMQTQAELGEEILQPILERQARSMILVAEQQLILMNDEYVEPRKIKILGENGKVDVQWMSNVDLRHHTDVHIEVESMYPDLRGMKRQTLLDLWDRKLVDDPQKILRAFRYGNFDMLLEETDRTEETVAIAIQQLKRGKMPMVTPFDNHLLFVKTLSRFIQTPEFLRIIPERKKMFIAFLQQHLGAVMNQMPAQGEVAPGTNQNAVNTPFGAQVPPGTQGNGSGMGQPGAA